MTKEQEEAIEKLKRELNNLEYTKDLDMASDNYFGQFEERINTIKTILSMLEEKDKQIDLMAKTIMEDENLICEFDFEDWENKEEVKQYFENEVRQESDKSATGK